MAASNFQRIGFISNTYVGRDFEACAQAHFARQGLDLVSNFSVEIGYRSVKAQRFDLGSDDPPMLVECNRIGGRRPGNSPSAKIRGMNEAMLYFGMRRHIIEDFILAGAHEKELSLAAYYVRTQGHLIPPGVEVWEYCTESDQAFQLS